MIPRFLVCPPEPALAPHLREGRGVVPVLERVEEIGRAVDGVRAAGAHLHCVWIRTDAPLAALRLDPSWDRVPLALFAPAMGRFRDVARSVPQWRAMNLRVYLPADSPENLAALRILSSLGVETGVLFPEKAPDWEMVADLMTWALFGRAPHAAMGPFQWMAGRYRATDRNDFSQFAFDDPRVYLHLDADGRVALTRKDLEEGRFAAASLEELGEVEEHPAYQEHLNRWREFFLRPDPCACCGGWKLCGGRFSHLAGEKDRACAGFFTEWMDALEQRQGKQPQPRSAPWQP